jgi:hypothetical protein
VHWLILDYHAAGIEHLQRLGLEPPAELTEFLQRTTTSVLVLAVAPTDKPRHSRKRRRR